MTTQHEPEPEPQPGLDETLARLGLAGWTPPGHLDAATGTWFVDRDVAASFPETGIDVFRSVDDDSFWFDHRNAVIDRVADRHAPVRAMLEVGSGSGVVADHLQSQGWAIATVEPVVGGAVASARRGLAASFCGDLASLKLPDGSVPVIGMFDVIEHIDDTGPLLAECHRTLRTDGVLVVTVPAYRWLWSDFDDWNGHFRRYTAGRLRAELAGAGFTVERDTHLFAPLLPPAAAMRLLPVVLSRLLPRGRRADRTEAEIERETSESLQPSSPIVDRVVRAVLAPEAHWLRTRRVPFGTSVLAVARKAAR